MGNETILYYVWEETITGCGRKVKTRFWRKIKPLSFAVEEDGLSVVTVMIPEVDKGWKKEKLLALMQLWMKECPGYMGFDEIVAHPKVQSFLRREDNFPPIFWELADKCFKEEFITKKRTPESVVLLMGASFFPEEQIQRFGEMMQPHFPRVNNLVIIYEDDETGQRVNDDIQGNAYDSAQGRADDIYRSAADINSGYDDKHEKPDAGIFNNSLREDFDVDFSRMKNRKEEAIDGFMEMLYYEYGLVAGVCRGGGYKNQGFGRGSGQNQTLYLDYGYQGKLPYSMMRAGGVYIDLLSSGEKEQHIRKKCSEISYCSPRKYLDTIVKSGYDKLVNQA